MKVYVEVANERDPSLNLRIANGTAIPELGDRLFQVSRAGRIAMDLARTVPDASITAFGRGPENESALVHALASGAGRAVQLIGQFNSREALAEWLKKEAPDVVIAGNDVACAATSLEWAHLAGIESFQILGNSLVALRSVERGDRQRIASALPVAIRPALSLRPRYVARAHLLAAREREMELISLEAPFSVKHLEEGPLQPLRVRAKLSASPVVSSSSASQRLKALMGGGVSSTSSRTTKEEVKEPLSLEAQAETFVRYLAHHQLLENSK